MGVRKIVSKSGLFTPCWRGAGVALLLMTVVGCGAGYSPARPSSSEAQYLVMARDVFDETNKLRKAPASHAKKLKDIASQMSGNIYYPMNSSVGVVTNEGVAAVNEAIAVLRKQKPLPTLKWSEKLAELARAHVADTGAKGLVGHDSSTGKSFSERVTSLIVSEKFSFGAENISYGSEDGRDVVSQLVVDDGVPGRGHRKNILTEKLNYSGVGCGYHREYGHMCVAIYAYRE